MRIVHIEDFFHPDAGYQVNILSRYQAAREHEVVIVCAVLGQMPDYLSSFFGKEAIGEKDEAFTASTGIRILRIPLIAYISGRAIYRSSIFREIENLEPDLLYVHGSDTYIGIRYAMKLRRISFPVVFDNHMLAMASRNRLNEAFRWFYRTFVAPRVLESVAPVIRVVDDDYVQRHLGIPAERSPVIGFGTDILLFKPDEEKRKAFRLRHAIGQDDFVAVYAGKLDVQKGGKFLADALRERISHPNGREIVFVIVGNAVGEYGRAIEETFAASGNRILRFPTQKYRDLAEFYQAADIALFPRQCSLSYFDVQSAGLPVIAEKNRINEERLSEGNGFTFNEGDMEDFRARIIESAAMPDSGLRAIGSVASRKIAERHGYDKIALEYERVIHETADAFTRRKEEKR